MVKAELVCNHGPWKSIDHLEIAEYMDWFRQHCRLYGEIGKIPPVEVESNYHHTQTATATADEALASV